MSIIMPASSNNATLIGGTSSGSGSGNGSGSNNGEQEADNDSTSINGDLQIHSSLVNKLIYIIGENLGDAQQVRKMIAQNQFKIIILIVIIIYLIYYFSKISKRPKLIGATKSKFVQYIRVHLRETLNQRFSPLIYFWGTNPQTALFGYLQGQPSLDEMPRSKFKRQFLYVSDAQYLTTNVDLSKHHHEPRCQHHKAGQPILSRPTTKTDADSSCSSSSSSSSSCGMDAAGLRNHLQVGRLRAAAPIFASYAPPGLTDQPPKEPMSLLERNIHLALEHMMASGNGKRVAGKLHVAHDEMKLAAAVAASSARHQGLSSSSSASGSSSDSGVFPSGNSSACWSASSRASSCSLKSEDEQLAGSELGGHSKPPMGQHCAARHHQHQKVPFCCKPPQDPEPILFANSPLVGGQLSKTDEPATRESQEFGQCALDWYRDSHQHYHKNKLVALLAAGMTTGSDRKYVTDTVATLDKLGYEVCVFIRRGVGGLRLSSAKFFSPAKWRDFEAAVLSVRQQRPGARLVAVGFSFGSLELCRYLAMSGAQSLIHVALLVSCPFDPEAGGRNMRKRALNKRIDKYLARNLGKQLHAAMFTSNDHTNGQAPTIITNLNGSLVDLSLLPKIKSLVEFEDNYNRPLQNYPDSEAYAMDSRLHNHLKFIKTPTLCLSSEDDFMAPVRLLPLKEIESNKNLCMILTKRGGHMGFVNGVLWPKKPYFAQNIIGQYMGAIRNSLMFDFDSRNDLEKGQQIEIQQTPLLDITMNENENGTQTTSTNLNLGLETRKNSIQNQDFQPFTSESQYNEHNHHLDQHDHYQIDGPLTGMAGVESQQQQQQHHVTRI